MKTSTLLKIVLGGLLALSLIVIPGVLATSAAAADQPTGSGPSSQTEVQKETKDQPSGSRLEAADPRELSRTSERPMSVPDGEGEGSMAAITGGQGLNDEVLEELRDQDDLSATSF